MRRRAVKVLLFLLAGAIVNVAVAWGCAWLALDVLDGSSGLAMISGTPWAAGPNWDVMVIHRPGAIRLYGVVRDPKLPNELRAPEAPSPTVPWMPHWSRFNAQPSAASDGAVDDARGWPMVTLRTAFDVRPLPVFSAAVTSNCVGGIFLPPLRSNTRTFSVWDLRALPLMPIWQGIAINTLFYACVVWLLIAGPLALRRAIRRRRGRCAACAYPIGVSPVCTECGAAVTPSPAGRGQG